jgi:peptide/nickel transport system permease protein
MIVHLLPGDPAMVMLGERATPEAVEKLREELGLNQPLPLQYAQYVGDLITGDFGRSIQTNEKISQILSQKFPATVELTVVALAIACLLGVLFGVLAAARRNSILDNLVMVGSLAGISMPIFWLALILLYLFAFRLGLFPVTGRLPPEYFFKPDSYFFLIDTLFQGRLDLFWASLKHLALPGLALATIPMAIIARITRASMIDALSQDYIRTARAKGLNHRIVVAKHGLSNALIPILTVIGLQFGYLLGGAIITETIFAWPGMGTWVLNAVYARDYQAVQAGVFTIGLSFILVNLLVDLTYAIVDPRVRSGVHQNQGS